MVTGRVGFLLLFELLYTSFNIFLGNATRHPKLLRMYSILNKIIKMVVATAAATEEGTITTAATIRTLVVAAVVTSHVDKSVILGLHKNIALPHLNNTTFIFHTYITQTSLQIYMYISTTLSNS